MYYPFTLEQLANPVALLLRSKRQNPPNDVELIRLTSLNAGKGIDLPKNSSKLLAFFTVFTILSAFALAVSLSGCNKSKSGSKKQAMFDLSHREIFSPDLTSEMGLSSFKKDLTGSGYTIKANEKPIAAKILRDSDLLILAGPMTEFTVEEIEVITDFVKNGGNLLVFIHISQPVFALSEQFDIQPSLATICDTADPVQNSPQDFYITTFADHPLGIGIDKLAVFRTWGLRIREGGSANIVAKTSDKAWADLNQDLVLNEGEPQEAYGIIAISRFGDGRAVICADDAILINKFIKTGNNQQFGKNIISWFENKMT